MATQPVLAGTTLPWPSKFKRTRTYRGGAAVMADGTQVTDLVQSNAKRLWTLGWLALNTTDLGTIRTAFDAVKNASGSYTDLDNSSYTVTLDGMGEMPEEGVIASGGPLWAVEIRLREV